MSHRPPSRRPSPDAPRIPRRGAGRTRLAFLLALVAQLLAVVVVPVAHASVARPLAAHIDLPGSLHHTHDEASCAPCSASHLLGTTPRVERYVPHAGALAASEPTAERATPESTPRRTAAAPRAPPTPARVG